MKNLLLGLFVSLLLTPAAISQHRQGPREAHRSQPKVEVLIHKQVVALKREVAELKRQVAELKKVKSSQRPQRKRGWNKKKVEAPKKRRRVPSAPRQRRRR
jgi:hypothetical protein